MTYDEVRELVKGKNVIVVGRAPYLLDNPDYKHQGEFIDSHDIIVRTNKTLPHTCKTTQGYNAHFVDRYYHELLGCKTHIQCISWAWHKAIAERAKIFVRDGGLCVCRAELFPGGFDTNKQYIETIQHHTKYHAIDDTQYSESFPEEHFAIGGYKTSVKAKDGTTQKKRYQPCMGIYAIQELLTFPLESLTLIGFTCGYRDLGMTNDQVSHIFHRMEADLYWLRQCVNQDKRIIIDNTLKTVFQEEKDTLKQLEIEIEQRQKVTDEQPSDNNS